jgi:hypothetical protein
MLFFFASLQQQLRGRGLLGELPWCKKADLMTADEAVAGRTVPGAAGEEGEA